MISKAYFSYFVRNHGCDDRFIELAQLMGMPEATKPEDFITALVRLQEACGVADLKMSDYGITKEDMAKCAANARHTMGGLFELDPYALSLDETTQIMMNAYK